MNQSTALRPARGPEARICTLARETTLATACQCAICAPKPEMKKDAE